MNSIWAASFALLLICLTGGCIVTGGLDPRIPLELDANYVWDADGDGDDDFRIEYRSFETRGSRSGLNFHVLLSSAGEDSNGVLLERQKGHSIGKLAVLEPGELVKVSSTRSWFSLGAPIPMGEPVLLGLRTTDENASPRYGWVRIHVDTTRIRRNIYPVVVLHDFVMAHKGDQIQAGRKP